MKYNIAVIYLMLAIIENWAVIADAATIAQSTQTDKNLTTSSEETNKPRKKMYKRFLWTKELDEDLIECWLTIPQKQYSNLLSKCWAKKRPDYAHLSPEKLRRHVKYLIDEKYKIQSGSEMQVENQGKYKRFRWNDELNDALLKIYIEKLGKIKHPRPSLHDFWIEKYPQYANISAKALRYHKISLMKKLKLTDKQQNKDSNIKEKKWTAEMLKDLKRIWQETYHPDDSKHMRRIHEQFTRLYPEYESVDLRVLKNYADRIAKKPKQVLVKADHNERIPPSLRLELAHTYRETNPQLIGHTKRLHKVWSRKHPEFVHDVAGNLKKSGKYWYHKILDNIPRSTEGGESEKHRRTYEQQTVHPNYIVSESSDPQHISENIHPNKLQQYNDTNISSSEIDELIRALYPEHEEIGLQSLGHHFF